jgi:tetratricopeptide (TPR) repeat protein
MKVGDHVGALKVAEELVAIRGSAQDWWRQGFCLAGLGRWDGALDSFDQATKRAPRTGVAWDLKGIALGNLGRIGEALAAFDKAITLDPSDTYFWLNRGSTLASLGRYDEALASYDRAVELDPQAALAWSTRAGALTSLKYYPEALASLDKARELGDASVGLVRNRAEVLLALNRWDEGALALEEALRQLDQAGEPVAGNPAVILRNLLTGTSTPEEWHTRVTTLVQLFGRYGRLPDLGMEIVLGIPRLLSPTISNMAAQTWLDVWQGAAGDRAELQLPLRLLDAAVRFRETRDRRILLELPVEERTLLEPLLGDNQSESN